MAFHMLWGLVLWLSISKLGPGISTDSVHLLFGGLNLAEGRGLYSFDGSFLLLWPPLYPVLLAGLHRLSGLDLFLSASLLQMASFVGASLCLSLIFLKIFPDRFWLALAANVLSDVGAVNLAAFDVVGSDYVHFLLVLIFLLLAGVYMERRTPRWLAAMAAVGMLAMLQRYLGLAVIATGVAAAFVYGGPAWRRRWVHGALTALGALPAGVWLWVSSQWIDRRAPIGFVDNFTWFSRAMLEWFFPENVLQPHLWLYILLEWLLILGLAARLIFAVRSGRRRSAFAFPMFL